MITLSRRQLKNADRQDGILLCIPWPDDLPRGETPALTEERDASPAERQRVLTLIGTECRQHKLAIIDVSVGHYTVHGNAQQFLCAHLVTERWRAKAGDRPKLMFVGAGETETTAAPGARYILNSAVITAPGTYRYRHIDADAARAWLRHGEWQSTIGYPETAAALSALCGINIPVDRRTIVMQAGDEALVFRLVLPPGTRRIEPDDKGRLTPEFVMQNCEIGLLRREA